MKLPIKSYLILIPVLSIIVMGCLKDKPFDNGEIQSVHSTGAPVKPIEIKLTAASTQNFLGLAFNSSPNDTIVNLIPVNLATADPAPQDLHVTLVQNDTLVTAYNTANGSSYLVPTAFTVVNPVVTIPKGSHTGYLHIKFKPIDFLGSSYALGFTITKVNETGYTVSGNLQNGIVAINIKNQYDGSYHVKGVRVHPTLGPFPFDYNANLNTVNGTTVDGNVLADLKEGLTMTINADNTVTLSGDLRTVFPQAGKVNSYDPATKTFTLNYYYNAAAPRLINETLVMN
jgi:hypothetical protein